MFWKMRKTPVTVKDIARIVGVSHSTVSRSLNDSPLISEEMKQVIRKVARRHHFDFNANARGLSSRRTGSIGIIFPDFFAEYRNSLYLELLMNDLRRRLEARSLDSIVTFPFNHSTGTSNIQKLIWQKKVDGLLIVLPEIEPIDWSHMKRSGIPFVLLHVVPTSIVEKDTNYVLTDHHRGGYLATEHLLRAGHRRILVLTERAAKDGQFELRTEGCRSALSDFGVPLKELTVVRGKVSYEFGYDAICEKSSRLSKIDAVFAHSDLTAIGVIAGLAKMGVRVPADIPVIGYDDIELGKHFRPRLTTIHQPHEKQAELACARLLDLIHDKPIDTPLREIIEPELIVRETCGAGRGR